MNARRHLSSFAAAVSLVAAACGVNVDLGGSAAADARQSAASACKAFAAPDAVAPCKGCSKDKTCQANGCFGGYLCDVSGTEPDCKEPGTACSAAGPADAHGS